MATRKDVAAAAGVSVRTVSNVVNGFEHVAPATRQRVLKAIEQLSYRPNELARSLKVGRSGLVGLMLPQLDNPYFAEITRAFVQEGTRHGLTVVIDQTDGDRERELSWIQRASGRSLFDALILSPLGLRSRDLETLPADTPVVLLGEHHYPGFDRIAVDGLAASHEIVAHLAANGRSRIAALGVEDEFRGTSAERFAGYRAGLSRARIDFDRALVGHVDGFSRSEGYRVMRQLLDQPDPPDAVYCFADPLALGALRALHELRVDVPGQVAVVGFDDVEDGRYSCPSLSSISPDKNWLAETVFHRLLQRLQGQALAPEIIRAPHRLEIRESSATVAA